jgi:hypothetical protein
MNWKKSLCVAILTGAALSALAGCSQAETTVPAAVQTPSATQPNTALARQTPPSGASFNGTMPLPPSGNVTGERPAAPTMDLAAAAAKLGITEAQLSEALGNTQQGFQDLAAAATKLGVSEDSLRQALGFSNNGTMPGGPPQGGSVPAGQGK